MQQDVARDHVNTFWNGDALTPVEAACLASFVTRGIEVRFFSYDAPVLPRGVTWHDASTILPRERLFHFDGSPSAFSNIFRYKLLFERGGWWVDTDVVMRGAGLPAVTHFWARQDRTRINGAVLKFPKGDGLCERLLDESEARARALTGWGEIGPDLLTAFIAGGPHDLYTQDSETTYPVHWLETHYFWFPEYLPVVHARIGRSIFVHLWNSLFDRMGLSLEHPVPRGSYLAELVQDLRPGHVVPLDSARRNSAAGSVRAYLAQDWVEDSWNATRRPGESLLRPQ
ncbi:hypothetical protein [Aestuariivirga litoralis]|uniref:hypothetical protein n=1 Tax=Aestuariivirga litoralis TaxID=2650924 RepID=UPI0011B3AA42|nr:hypothetical protein [Aestuariivirga litoralis]